MGSLVDGGAFSGARKTFSGYTAASITQTTEKPQKKNVALKKAMAVVKDTQPSQRPKPEGKPESEMENTCSLGAKSDGCKSTGPSVERLKVFWEAVKGGSPTSTQCMDGSVGVSPTDPKKKATEALKRTLIKDLKEAPSKASAELELQSERYESMEKKLIEKDLESERLRLMVETCQKEIALLRKELEIINARFAGAQAPPPVEEKVVTKTAPVENPVVGVTEPPAPKEAPVKVVPKTEEQTTPAWGGVDANPYQLMQMVRGRAVPVMAESKKLSLVPKKTLPLVPKKKLILSDADLKAFKEGKAPTSVRLETIYISGVPRIPYSRIKAVMTKMGIQKGWVKNLSFVGSQTLEMIVSKERAEEISATITKNSRVLKVDKNFDPLAGGRKEVLDARSNIESNLTRLPVAMHAVRKDLTKKLQSVKDKLLALEKAEAVKKQLKLDGSKCFRADHPAACY